jgi:hypothetical protein
MPLTPRALAALLKDILTTKVLHSNSQFTNKLIGHQGDQPAHVLGDALVETINNTVEQKCHEDAVSLVSSVRCERFTYGYHLQDEVHLEAISRSTIACASDLGDLVDCAEMDIRGATC